ncbi:hypothetical protein Ddye_002068 [Dipteronia dyeriana]|uniref:Reverse transcriptase zinc-binding domain-containing protein n=1 Tax=Dipteronia dyeriana TaxID=168575 RepID=A0AAD9XPQ9_9ROSI|nr:hypothetical protein Ddye_002068 [Dipteronia dyeriana]
MWGKDLLKAGIRWWVGNGDSIYVYKDKWALRPSTFTVISPPKLDVNTKVSQLIMPFGGWNLQLLKDNFSASDVNDIIKIPIGKRDKKDDIIWHYNGKALDPAKVKIFIWKACHDLIPIKFNIAHRGVEMSSVCDACKSQAFLDDYISANKKTRNSQNPRCNIGNNRWQPPEKGFYKVNCVALVDRVGGRTGIGVVIRDEDCNVLASCAQNLVANLNCKAAKLTAILKKYPI